MVSQYAVMMTYTCCETQEVIVNAMCGYRQNFLKGFLRVVLSVCVVRLQIFDTFISCNCGTHRRVIVDGGLAKATVAQ